MTKQLSPLEALKEIHEVLSFYDSPNLLLTCFELIEKALKKQVKDELELEVYKLAYEWKCNGVEGTYEEVLEQARKTVKGWKEIERKGYGTIITD